MVRLARDLRSLGLPALVLHLGRVSDIGYSQRSSNGKRPVKAFTELQSNANILSPSETCITISRKRFWLVLQTLELDLGLLLALETWMM
jgi:hypothetical protein